MHLKRILAGFLVVTLILSAFAFPVGAETTTVFEVGVKAEPTTLVSSSPAIYKSGDKVSIKISADQNTGVTIFKFSVKFDSNALEFVDYTSTNLFNAGTENVKVNDDSIFYVSMASTTSTATGEMLTLNFKVKETFCGETTVYAEIFAGNDKNCINGLNVVPFVGGSASFTAHAIDVEAGVVTDPTCTEEGFTTYHCAVCEKYVVGNTVAALGHTEAEAVVENTVEPTCTEQGSYDSVVYCTVCEAELSRETVATDALGHTAGEAVVENTVDPTCTEQGSYDSVVYCTVCEAELSRETVATDALGHTEAEAVVENTVEPTCTEQGSYDSVVYCSVCEAELSRETVAIDALGHDLVNHEAKAPTCTEIGWEAYDTCSSCDYTTYEELAALGHSFGEWVVTKEPTITETGIKVATCSVCQETKEEIIPYSVILGDVDGSEEVTDADAEYLLMYTFFPEDYPINQDADFTGDGSITDADAEYLLMFTFFPEDYPLNTK